MASRGKMADDHGEAHRALFEECLAKLTVGGERSGFLTKEKYDEPLMTPQLVGLEQALEGWQQMKEVGLRAAMKDVSAVGGQGMLRCSCKGACNRNTCTCFKNGRRCNSRCHAGSKACCNHD